MDLEELLADPPRVHPEAPLEVWVSERSLYELLIEEVGHGARTVETGLGISTALLASLGAQHICIVADQAQVDRLRGWGKVDLSTVTFCVDYSDQVVPTLTEPLDLAFVDGGHGFPMPIIDWYFTARLLVPGGLMLIDDIQLPHVQYLTRFLDADPRWMTVARTDHWAAYRRGDHDVREEWTEQPFVKAAPKPAARRLSEGLNRWLPGRFRR
jgi:predicted O-methyltransferase YrrM